MDKKDKYKQKIFDSEFGEYRTYLDFADEYGFEFADIELKRQQEKSSTNPARSNNSQPERQQSAQVLTFIPNKNSHKQQPIDGQFLPLEYEKFFSNETLMKSLASKAMLFLFLLFLIFLFLLILLLLLIVGLLRVLFLILFVIHTLLGFRLVLRFL